MAINKDMGTEYGPHLNASHHVSIKLSIDRKKRNIVVNFAGYNDVDHYTNKYKPISWINLSLSLDDVSDVLSNTLDEFLIAVEEEALKSNIFLGGTRINDDEALLNN